MTVRLHNIGKRTIQIHGKEFNPNQVGDFDDAIATNLLKLYPDEVKSAQTAVQQFSDPSAPAVNFEQEPVLTTAPDSSLELAHDERMAEAEDNSEKVASMGLDHAAETNTRKRK